MEQALPLRRHIYNLHKMDACDDNLLLIKPIGYMKTCFATKNGTPRQPTVCPSSEGKLQISKEIFTNPDHSLIGLADFSHVWILFHFHLNGSAKNVKPKVKPPRMNGSKTGVFSTRSPHRPNPIGLTLAKLESINDAVITVSGVDIVDGTPIIDIKPYIPSYDSIAARTDGSSQQDDNPPHDGATIANWVGEKSTLKVVFSLRALANVEELESGELAGKLEFCSNIKKSIAEILCEDPRSTYRRTKCGDRLYYFTVNQVHVTVWFDGSTSPTTAEVLRVQKIDQSPTTTT